MTQPATRPTVAREFLTPFRRWIEKTLGVALDDSLLLEVDVQFGRLAASRVMDGVALHREQGGVEAEMDALIEKIELPPGYLPALAMSQRRATRSSFADTTMVWSAQWQDCPVALTVRGVSRPIVVAVYSYSDSPLESCKWGEVVIAAKTCVPELLNVLQRAAAKTRTPRLQVWEGAAEAIPHCRWEDLTLEASIVHFRGRKRPKVSYLHRCLLVCNGNSWRNSLLNSSIRRRLRLDAGEYDQLRRRVLARDGWRCQACGSRTQLDTHHIDRCNRGGDDTEDDLLTLCRACHRSEHHVG